MFSHIEGILEEKHTGELVLDVNGIGFLLQCSGTTLAAAPATGQKMRCYTHFSVKEDSMDLYGFATREEREMFRRLCRVNGVGAKMALSILSTLSVRDLALAIITNDKNALARAPGVGKKIAERIAMELRDKVEQNDIGAAASVTPAVSPDAAEEAVLGLIGLGYSAQEARIAVSKVHDQSDKPEMLILLALKGLGG